jgi:hypothetical protein
MVDSTNTHNDKINTRHIPQPDKNYLWMSSAGLCSYPNCRKQLVVAGTDKDGPATIGQFAHIFAHSENGPRPNPDGFTEETNSYENLILLCSNHHREVDVQSNTFTVSELIKWKRDHEKWVAYRLSAEEFNSADLEAITNWIADNSELPSTDYSILPLAEKMAFNSMSATTQQLINMGLMRVGEVKTYVTHRTKLETTFAERLLKPLINQYNTMRTNGLNSDFVFEELRQFACGRSLDFRKQAAGLAVVVYFFERCEIFEK